MKVQTKILLLLALIVGTFVGALVLLRWASYQKFRGIADARAVERNRVFDEFLNERGDRLKVLVEDSTNWDDLVRAIVKDDLPWVEEHLGGQTMSTYSANAIWIYKPDLSLFYSTNNRYSDILREAPLPPHALQKLIVERQPVHYFVHTPLGWMEVRGSTIHPSADRFRETTPQGYFVAGHFWIDENIRRMAQFTNYDIRIVPADATVATERTAEEEGLITFSRMLPGWDGRPVAQIAVKHDSPIIRELNRAGKDLFIGLLIFAAALFLVLATSLYFWVRRPLCLISENLEQEHPEGLVPLARKPHEFGRLAELILKFRSTEEALHKTEELLRHSQKMEAVGRLAGGVAHDFNNLLTAIIGYSELLESRFARDGAALDEIRMIRQAGERAAALTKQLLAFSRKQLLQPRVIDLNVLVREMEKLLQRVIGEHIHIVLQLDASDARVRADPNQLEQVILNLGVNARDAMHGGGTLTLTTSKVRLDAAALAVRGVDVAIGDYVSLSVTDTGSGMDDETKLRIFEPFFTTKGPGKGTGLGLATVYGIVKQTGGGISVESTVGRGSTFVVYLPAEDAPLETTETELPPVQHSRGGETVLVAEDEEVVRTLVCAVLTTAGYHVLCASGPSEALKLAREKGATIQLLVTDVVMPEMHGPALAKMLAPLQPMMRVLYISGYSENDISAQGVLDPNLDVLQKPFTHQSLVRKVRELLDQKPPVVEVIGSAETPAASPP